VILRSEESPDDPHQAMSPSCGSVPCPESEEARTFDVTVCWPFCPLAGTLRHVNLAASWCAFFRASRRIMQGLLRSLRSKPRVDLPRRRS
jgi:hypothetical protein